MNKWKYFSPEGVRDLLPAEFLAEEELRRRLTEYLHQSGLRGLGTPEIEFYDLYASGRFAPQEGLFKFIDERGRILCLRYDGTIPLARVLGTSLREHQLPDGFWYLGSVFRYNEQGGGKLRAFQQAGVELIGAGGTRADAEALRLASGFLAAAGLKEYTFALGEVSYFKYLLEIWRLDAEAEMLLSPGGASRPCRSADVDRKLRVERRYRAGTGDDYDTPGHRRVGGSVGTGE